MKSIRKHRRKKPRQTNKNRVNGIKGRGIMQSNPLIEEKEAFDNFLINSRVELLTNGAYGLIFKLTINDIENSTYISSSVDTHGSKISTLLLKLNFIKKDKNADIYIEILGEEQKFKFATRRECMEEINLQKYIYSKTNDFLEPICPAIVFDTFLEDEMSKHIFMGDFLKYASNDNVASHVIADILSKINEFDIGIFAMEFADGYDMLSNNDPNVYKEMAMFLLLEMALKTGYSHADFHRGNIMINKTSTTYFNQSRSYPIVGKPLLIDFGLSKKIPNPVKRIIEELCDLGKYTKALNVLCSVSRKDGKRLTQFPAYYGWACGSAMGDSNVINAEIQKRIALKEQQNVSLMELLRLNFNDKTNQKFSVLLQNGDFKTEIEKQKQNGSLEKDIINNLYQMFYYVEKRKYNENIEQIKEQIESDVLDEMADIRNLQFPEYTDRNIGALFEQKRNAEIDIAVRFNLPQPL